MVWPPNPAKDPAISKPRISAAFAPGTFALDIWRLLGVCVFTRNRGIQPTNADAWLSIAELQFDECYY